MTDVTFLTVLVAGCWLIGWGPCRLLLPSRHVAGQALAAPVLGFALFGIVAAVLYRLDVPTGGLSWVFGGLALGGLLLVIQRRPQGSVKIVAIWSAASVAVGLLLLLPKWTGGPQFFVFQGNIWDQFNYLARTVSYRDFTYHQLMTLDQTGLLLNNFVGFARGELLARPAISIVHAALLPFSGEPPTLNAYVFMVFLQLLSFFALAFVAVVVFGVRAGLAATLAAALTLGFFLQYVFDINAWSQLAGMPHILLAVTLVLLLLDVGEERSWRDDLRLAGGVALTLSAALYYYPEIVPIYLVPLAGVVGLALMSATTRAVVRGRALLVGGAGLLAVAMTVPCWDSTTAFLIRQFTTSMSQAVDWFLYFQRYLAPADLTAFFTIGYKTGHYPPDLLWQAILFVPIDLVTGLVGLYMLQPPADLPLVERVLWRLVVLAALGALLIPALSVVWKAAWQSGGDRAARMLRLTLLALLMPLPFVLLGKLWSAGKAIAMIGPFLFLLVVAPLLRTGEVRVWRGPALVFLAIQLGFGLVRPLAATHPDGIHYPLPYPSVQRADLKTGLSWDLKRWNATLRGCRRIAVDTENPFLERYVQLYLTDMKTVWWSVRPLNGYFDRGLLLGLQPARGEPDCRVTDRNPTKQTSGVTVITLGRSPGG